MDKPPISGGLDQTEKGKTLVLRRFRGSELLELKRLVDAGGSGRDLRSTVYSVITHEAGGETPTVDLPFSSFKEAKKRGVKTISEHPILALCEKKDQKRP